VTSWRSRVARTEACKIELCRRFAARTVRVGMPLMGWTVAVRLKRTRAVGRENRANIKPVIMVMPSMPARIPTVETIWRVGQMPTDTDWKKGAILSGEGNCRRVPLKKLVLGKTKPTWINEDSIISQEPQWDRCIVNGMSVPLRPSPQLRRLVRRYRAPPFRHGQIQETTHSSCARHKPPGSDGARLRPAPESV